MSVRLLFEVALRAVGIWFLFSSFVTLMMTASWYLSNATVGGPNFLMSSGVYGTVQLALGVVLIRWAPSMTARFYPPDAEQPQPQIRVGRGDIYHTACFVLGVYLFVQGLNSTGQLAVSAISSGWIGSQLAHLAVPAMVYTSSGLLLIFGSRRIGQLAASLKYDPESIPRQQFSLKLLLIITGVVAVILGMIRMLSTRGM